MKSKKSKETSVKSEPTEVQPEAKYEQEPARKHVRRKIPVAVWQITAVFVVIGVAVGVYFGVQSAFEKGTEEGREAMTTEISDILKELGTAVAEKSGFVDKIKSIMAEIPSEVNTEKIDEYIKKIEQLASEIETKDVKPVIDEYLEKWQKFKETYASEDNDAISEEFNALKSAAEDIAGKIRSLYDNNIKGAIDKL